MNLYIIYVSCFSILSSHIVPVDSYWSARNVLKLSVTKSQPYVDITNSVETWETFNSGDHGKFLSDFWQKKPLLIRGAFSNFKSPLSADELAGLACSEDVESRIISGGKEGKSDWSLRHGPFDDDDFESNELGDSHWTLLVNELNRHIPEVSDMLSTFGFIPNWRVDDIMLSYAATGGSVGPHVDNYDVFLLQGAGTRSWAIENHITSVAEEKERLIEGLDIRVLRDFKCTNQWVLRPGDMLYLPPRFAHHGVSLDDDCMTYSIGFRAPSHRDLLTFFADEIADSRISEGSMYQDPDLTLQSNRGLISPESIKRAKSVIQEALLSATDDELFFSNWFGSLVTKSRRDHSDYPVAMEPHEVSATYQNPEAILNAMKKSWENKRSDLGPFLYRTEALTFAYIENSNGTSLFIDGNRFEVANGIEFVAPILCEHSKMSPNEFGKYFSGDNSKALTDFLTELLLEGYLYSADD